MMNVSIVIRVLCVVDHLTVTRQGSEADSIQTMIIPRLNLFPESDDLLNLKYYCFKLVSKDKRPTKIYMSNDRERNVEVKQGVSVCMSSNVYSIQF